MINRAALSSPEQDAREVAGALQGVLVDLIDLSLIGKHAHWNVRGTTFLVLRRQLDELVDEWRRLSDEVAERIAALEFAPDGRVQAIAGHTPIEPLRAGPVRDTGLVDSLSERLTAVILRTRDARHAVEPSDALTDHLLSDVLRALDRHRWMVGAQRDATHRRRARRRPTAQQCGTDRRALPSSLSRPLAPRAVVAIVALRYVLAPVHAGARDHEGEGQHDESPRRAVSAPSD